MSSAGDRRLRPDPLRRLALHFLQSSSRVAIITGAGLSAASGVPVFRGEDPSAIWVQRVRGGRGLGVGGWLGFEKYRSDPMG